MRSAGPPALIVAWETREIRVEMLEGPRVTVRRSFPGKCSHGGLATSMFWKSPLGFPWWEAVLWAGWPLLLRPSQDPQTHRRGSQLLGAGPLSGASWRQGHLGDWGACVSLPMVPPSVCPQDGTSCGSLVAGTLPGLRWELLGGNSLSSLGRTPLTESLGWVGAGQREQGREKIPEGQREVMFPMPRAGARGAEGGWRSAHLQWEPLDPAGG